MLFLTSWKCVMHGEAREVKGITCNSSGKFSLFHQLLVDVSLLWYSKIICLKIMYVLHMVLEWFVIFYCPSLFVFQLEELYVQCRDILCFDRACIFPTCVICQECSMHTQHLAPVFSYGAPSDWNYFCMQMSCGLINKPLLILHALPVHTCTLG